jgi:hypothetical protein
MKRVSLALAAILTCLLVASVGTASAMPTEENFTTSCKATSNNVVGNRITIAVTGKNVDPSQAQFANCGVVRKVARGLTSIRIEKPKVIEGFRCTPRVLTGGEGTVEPQKVVYNCLFRGADTATEIRLRFKVTYNTD